MGNYNTKQIIPSLKYNYVDIDNWVKPDKLTFHFYELSICKSIDFRSSEHKQIKEIYICEFDIGINKEGILGKKYNIILDAGKHKRYEARDFMAINYKPCKLLKTFILEDQEKINEIFEAVKIYIKSENLHNQVDSLFNLMSE